MEEPGDPELEVHRSRYSFYWYLTRRKSRPPSFQPDVVLAEAGALPDTARGWSGYRDYLAWQAAEGPAGKNKAYVSLSKGWALGSTGFKTALVKDHALAAIARAWETQSAREIREKNWEDLFQGALLTLGRTESELARGPKSAPWKVAIAVFLKERTQASNDWLAHRLKIGPGKYVGRLATSVRCSSTASSQLQLLRGKWAT